MKSRLFLSVVVVAIAMVLAPDLIPCVEPASAEAAPQRRRTNNRRRASNSQANRSRAARAAQQRRLRNQQLARLNRARTNNANQARMNAARANYNRLAAARLNPNARPGAGANANVPVVVYKDYQLHLGENINVTSLTPLGRKAAVEDVAVGQTVSVIVAKEPSVTGKANAPGQVTGQVVKIENNSASQELTVRVASYQVGGKAGEATTVAAVAGQSVTGITIRSKAAQNVAGLFKQ